MKFHLFNLFLLIITICFFQPTHQYRLSKRLVTEHDLTNFIVRTCSADRIDSLIQTLCDDTLKSALMGNFSFLKYYCETIGAEMSYCQTVNYYFALSQNYKEKRSVNRRYIRSLEEQKDSNEEKSQMGSKIDLELKLSMQICMRKIEEEAVDAIEYCNRTLQERYTDIERLCEHYPDFDYCRLVRSPSSFYLWLLSSSHSIPAKINPLIFSSSKQKNN